MSPEPDPATRGAAEPSRGETAQVRALRQEAPLPQTDPIQALKIGPVEPPEPAVAESGGTRTPVEPIRPIPGSHNYAAAVYGSVLAATVVISAGDLRSPVTLAVLLVSSGMVFWIAHVYAASVASVHGGWHYGAIRTGMAEEWPVASAAIPPAIAALIAGSISSVSLSEGVWAGAHRGDCRTATLGLRGRQTLQAFRIGADHNGAAQRVHGLHHHRVETRRRALSAPHHQPGGGPAAGASSGLRAADDTIPAIATSTRTISSAFNSPTCSPTKPTNGGPTRNAR